MSQTPARLFCDFCTNEIRPHDKRVTIEVPFTLSERRALAAEWDKDHPDGRRSIFGDVTPTLQHISRTYTVVACLTCITAILPNAITLRKTKVAEFLEQMQQDRARRQRDDEDEEIEADC